MCFNYTKTVCLRRCHIVFGAMTSLDCYSSKSEVIEQGLSVALETQPFPLLNQRYKGFFFFLCMSTKFFERAGTELHRLSAERSNAAVPRVRAKATALQRGSLRDRQPEMEVSVSPPALGFPLCQPQESIALYTRTACPEPWVLLSWTRMKSTCSHKFAVISKSASISDAALLPRGDGALLQLLLSYCSREMRKCVLVRFFTAACRHLNFETLFWGCVTASASY